MDDDRLYFASIIPIPFLEVKTPGSRNRRGRPVRRGDRQRNQSDFQMVCYDRLLLIDVENCLEGMPCN